MSSPPTPPRPASPTLASRQTLEVEGRSARKRCRLSSGSVCWRLMRRRCGPHEGVGGSHTPGVSATTFLLTAPATASHSPGCSRSGSAPRSGFRFLAAWLASPCLSPLRFAFPGQRSGPRLKPALPPTAPPHSVPNAPARPPLGQCGALSRGCCGEKQGSALAAGSAHIHHEHA